MLLLTTFDAQNLTTGQGIILTHYARALSRMPGVCFAHARIATPATVGQEKVEGIPPVFELVAPPMSRWSAALGLLGLGRGEAAAQLAAALQNLPAPVDAIVWVGAPADPLSLRLPRLCDVPVFYFAIDSYGLHAMRDATSLARRLKAKIAVWVERRLLGAGYKGVIYVSVEDFEFAMKLRPAIGEPELALIPIGIDLEEWPPRSPSPVTGRPRVIFSGVMNFPPNVRAASYLVSEVLPLVAEQCELRVVGKTPTGEVRALARRDERVVVTGTVPDMGLEYRAADIFVAPMVETAGIKIKLLQAMATGLPIVATPCCMAAFPRRPGSVLVAESAAEFAAELTRLIRDPKRRRRLGRANRQFIETDWSWDSRAVALTDFMHAAL